MDPVVARWLITARLEDGRLPHSRITDVLDSPGDGQPCDGCGVIITKAEKAVNPNRRIPPRCFRAWTRTRVRTSQIRRTE